MSQTLCETLSSPLDSVGGVDAGGESRNDSGKDGVLHDSKISTIKVQKNGQQTQFA